MIRLLVGVALAVGLGAPAAIAQVDDFRADAQTTCTITPGAAVNGTIEVTTDTDWCRVQMEAGRNQAFQVQVQGQPGQSLTLPSADARIYDAGGNLLAPAGSADEFVSYTPVADGAAYVDVRPSNNFYDFGSYRLVMAPRDQLRADAQTTGVTAPGQAVAGAIEGRFDADWFRVTLLPGRRYEFRLLRNSDNPALSLANGSLELRSAAGAVLVADTGTLDPSFQILPTTGGDAYVVVKATTSTGTYQLEQSALDDQGQTTATAGATAPGRVFEGSIEVENDVDLFKFNVERGRRHRVTIQGAGIDNLTNAHVCVQVNRPDGGEYSFQCSGGAPSASLGFTTDQAGEWQIGAFARFFQTGTYRITLSGRDDFGADLQTEGRVEPGFFAFGSAEAPGDEDWYRTHLVAGQQATVRVRHAQSGIGTLGNSRLYVLDPSGVEVASDIGGGGEPVVTFTPTLAGDYVVRVVGFCFLEGVGCYIGTYRVEVAQGSAVPVTTTIAAATLPNARSVQVGDRATFFGTILNTGSQTAANCGVATAAASPAGFTFARTNAANVVVGAPNQRFDIAAGAAQGMVLTFAPSEALAGQSYVFDFRCSNTAAAAAFDGVNSFTLVASNTAAPDVIMVAATPTNDGIANIPGQNGTGFFTTAAINIGAAGTIVFEPQSTPTLGLAPLICETHPATGQCITPLGANVTRAFGVNETAFFSVFFAGGGQTVPFDPANRRIRFVARDPGATPTIRGWTSVAVRTQ